MGKITLLSPRGKYHELIFIAFGPSWEKNAKNEPKMWLPEITPSFIKKLPYSVLYRCQVTKLCSKTLVEIQNCVVTVEFPLDVAVSLTSSRELKGIPRASEATLALP